MVEYTDISKYASKAYANALLSNEEEARHAAESAVTELGLTRKIAEEIAKEIAARHHKMTQNIVATS